MPIIHLPEDPLHAGDGAVACRILATMLYPQSQKNRERWLAATMAAAYSVRRQEGATDDELSAFHCWINILTDLPQSPQRIRQDGLVRAQRADLCAHLLFHLLALAQHHPRHFKVERAQALIIKLAQQEGRKASQSLIEKVWPEFKSVSHLWGAMQLLSRQGEALKADNASWLLVLGIAESIRLLAEDARILKPSQTWKAPEDLELPSHDISIPPLSPERLAALDDEFPV